MVVNNVVKGFSVMITLVTDIPLEYKDKNREMDCITLLNDFRRHA